MKKMEMIKQIYQKENITVDEDYINNVMKNKQRVQDFMRLYKEEEIEAMNEILGKPFNNKYFTKFELEAMSKINLFDRQIIKWAKLIWKNKDDELKLDEIIKYLNKIY